MKEIKIGDTVVLNSGGPRMTIKDLWGEGTPQAAAAVAWVAADGRAMEHSFPLVCLREPKDGE